MTTRLPYLAFDSMEGYKSPHFKHSLHFSFLSSYTHIMDKNQTNKADQQQNAQQLPPLPIIGMDAGENAKLQKMYQAEQMKDKATAQKEGEYSIQDKEKKL
jgi:hypothetical protein